MSFVHVYRAIGNNPSSITAWACGNCETWGHLKRGFKAVGGEYAVVGEKASSQVSGRRVCGGGGGGKDEMLFPLLRPISGSVC